MLIIIICTPYISPNPNRPGFALIERKQPSQCLHRLGCLNLASNPDSDSALGFRVSGFLPSPVNRRQPGVHRVLAEQLLDAQQLVVLGQAV